MYSVNQACHGAILGSVQAETRQSAYQSGSHVDVLARNWLEGHSRIMNLWLERLVSENGDAVLIDTLHRQSEWLREMNDQMGHVE